jgi:hypothetical protein
MNKKFLAIIFTAVFIFSSFSSSANAFLNSSVSLAGEVQTQAIFLNDPGYTENYLDIDKQWGLVKAGFLEGWQITVGSKSNIVAVIDTGIDQTHQDLRSINFVEGFDFINKQAIKKYSNSDDNGHGTLVAGVLGATPNNGIGVAGTNWQISIMPIKALDSTGKGDVFTLAQAIVWATDNGAQFINLSVGGIGSGHDATLSAAIAYAYNKNVLIVSAAGNDLKKTGDNLDLEPIYPICDDNNTNMVLGVAASDQNDLKALFSNYGKNCIDVSAPGKRILSTINYDPVTKKEAPNAYAYASGTSLAVPYVVGLAALIKSINPNYTNVQIRDAILNSADKIDNYNLSQCGGSSCSGYLGTGRINVVKSLNYKIQPNYFEGDLIRLNDNPAIVYQILGGQKRLVSPFVFNQRFLKASFKDAFSQDMASFPTGPYVTPEEGTLVKIEKSPTVYAIVNGKKMPVTQTVFKQRNYSYSQVKTLSFDEVNSWTEGSFFPPTDGTVLKTAKNKTIYWVVGQTLHAVNKKFYDEKGLKIFPVTIVPDLDVKGFAQGEPYIK